MTREEIARRHEDMRAFKAEGHTAKEVAEKFGCSVDSARSICRGIAPQGYSKNRNKTREEINAFIEERVPGCMYYGNYTGADGRADLKCKKCGTIFNRSMISVRKGHCSCPNCREKKQNEDSRKKSFEKSKRRMKAEANKQNSWRQIRVASCERCGEIFYTTHSKRRYCSEDCRKEAEKKYSSYNHGSDDRLNRTNIIDKDISLEKLYLRDNGVCQICGGLCDYNDCYTNENGTFIAGGTYPSRDHIVPLSKGGKHSWDNVRLAHRSCNSKIFWNLQRFDPSLGAELCKNA